MNFSLKSIPYLDILQRNDALGDVLGGVLEVVEASVTQDEPASLPILPTVKKMHFRTE